MVKILDHYQRQNVRLINPLLSNLRHMIQTVHPRRIVFPAGKLMTNTMPRQITATLNAEIVIQNVPQKIGTRIEHAYWS